MYQFSDSDSVDSDNGIRYKTESIRNKSANENVRVEKDNYRRRERSRSRSRSRHHNDRKKLKKRSKDRSPEDKSNRKSSKSSRSRSKDEKLDYRERRKEKDRSKKDDKSRNDHSTKAAAAPSERCVQIIPDLPKKVNDNQREEPDLQRRVEKSGPDSPKSVDNITQDLSFGPTLPPKLNTTTPTENKDDEQNGNLFGPQLPPHLQKKPNIEDNIIGPVLPPHFITVSSLDEDNSTDKESSHEDNTVENVVGPALSPDLKENKEESTSNTIGPVLPPHLRHQLENSSNAPEEDESEDEEVYGPIPAGANYSQAHVELEERALRMKMDQLGPSDDKQPVREEWMLTLPESKAIKFGLGPRQFRSKAGPDMTDRSSWTDTPEDKVKKKEGKVEPVVDLKREAELKQIQSRDKEQEAMAKKHKKEKDSLLEIHRKKLKMEKKNDSGPSERRPFSREVDLQVNRFDDAQKKAVLKKAQLLDSRFSSGESKFL